MSQQSYLNTAITVCAALLIAYASCSGFLSLERWRVRENDIPDFLLHHDKDTDMAESIVTIYSHGYADTYRQAYRYTSGGDHYGYISDKELILPPFVTFNYPDAAKSVLPVKSEYTSMGQDNDMEKLYTVVDQIAPQCKGMIGYGCSRGAATLVNLFERYSHIEWCALVLESVFSDIEHVVDTIVERSKLSWLPGMRKSAHKMFASLFPLYKKNGPKPCTAIRLIPRDIPVLIVCSLQDGLVKANASIDLYYALKEAGHSNAHLFVAEHGKHSKISSGPSGETYQNVVHAFYKRYDLPHNPVYAQAGAAVFDQCQPDIMQKPLVYC